MRIVVPAALVVAPLLAFTGCGGGSPLTSSSAGAPRAALEVTQPRAAVLGHSSRSDHLLKLDLPVTVDNATLVPCDLSYGRLQLFVDDMEIERYEVSATDIVALAGTNRVIAGRPLAVTFVFEVRSREFTGVSLTLGVRDANGHELEEPLANLRVELASELTTP